jgi:hypothetical protein
MVFLLISSRPREDVCRRTRDHEPEEQVSDWKYVWPEDHGYFSSVEVVCPAWFEGEFP